MKPLSQSTAKELLKRLDDIKGSEIRQITMISPTCFKIEVSVQDANRGYDWINIIFEVSGVTDAKLIDDVKLNYVDMSEGISIVFEDARVGLGNIEATTLERLKEAQFYLLGSSIKYEELPFREL
jgi:hypothetical protein